MTARAYRSGFVMFGIGAAWLALAPCATAAVLAALGLLLMAATSQEGA